MLDFKTLRLGFRPNQFLICPKGWNDEEAHEVSPILPVPVKDLRSAWENLLDSQPRLETKPSADEGTYYELTQRSAVFGFPDNISAVLVPLGRAQSTLAIYSRSTYGYSDLGVNKARVKGWIEALENELLQN